MRIRTFVARLLIVMTLVFAVAMAIVVSVNYQSRQSYWALADAHQYALQWQEARESIVQLAELGEPIPADTLEMLASLPLPLGCCESERSVAVESLKSIGNAGGADRYRASAAWGQLLLKQRLSLAQGRRELAAEIAIRNWMIPSLSVLALAMVLLLSWTLVKARIIAPTEKLSNYANRLLRGRQSQGLDMSGAPKELSALYEAFELTIGDFRGQLNARRERVLEMSGESDLLEMQVQSLVEMSERPAFVLDVTGAVRTWNRRMISLTGISKNQAIRGLFSADYVDVTSQEMFDVAMQTARSGKLPDEFGCRLLLQGGREVPVTIQLSPQVEPGLGVNRVLGVVSEDKIEGIDSLRSSNAEHATVENSLFIEYVAALEKGVAGMAADGKSLTETEMLRRQKAIAQTLAWLNKHHDARAEAPIDATELIAHVISVFGPKAQELDVDLQTDLKAGMAMTKISAGALVEIFNTLLSNALDAMQINGSGKRNISITTEMHDAYFIVQVADTGVGLTSAANEWAFEPFFTTKADRGALGLGLGHARYMAKMAGGSLDLSNPRLGQGTTATLRLPTTEAAQS